VPASAPLGHGLQSRYKARVYRKSVGTASHSQPAASRLVSPRTSTSPTQVPNSLPLRPPRQIPRPLNKSPPLSAPAPLRLRLNRGRLEQCSPFAGFLPGGLAPRPSAPSQPRGSPRRSRGELRVHLRAPRAFRFGFVLSFGFRIAGRGVPRMAVRRRRRHTRSRWSPRFLIFCPFCASATGACDDSGAWIFFELGFVWGFRWGVVLRGFGSEIS
jgi:hypothetical protein